ncbi:hypothetical protein KFE25_001490 [Diacronema lutheri]|uniref:Uncharacterized protein n=2 Tax=Diacronema lutheri TaxID=2081491 RepID=A0A8J6C1M9_DIALT|nr:hypothetical protein KFE25_001490 [Diacronema lutheri]
MRQAPFPDVGCGQTGCRLSRLRARVEERRGMSPMSPVAEQLLTPHKAGALPPAKRTSPLSVLALIIVALVLVQPLWGVLVQLCSWAAWLGCSLVLWEGAKGAVLPRLARPEHMARAQIGLMLVTFVVLRAVFGWHTPVQRVSRFYFSAVLLPALDTFVGLETIGGLARFATAGQSRRAGCFPAYS